MSSAEEQAIQGVIDQIWDTYDVDKSGALDKQETKKFVQDTLGNLGSGDEFSDEAFDEVFATFEVFASLEFLAFLAALLSFELFAARLSLEFLVSFEVFVSFEFLAVVFAFLLFLASFAAAVLVLSAAVVLVFVFAAGFFF